MIQFFDAKENFMEVIKGVIFENFEKSTFEARQNYYKLFPEPEQSEFPTFFRLEQTGISLELPKKFIMTPGGWTRN